MYVYRVSLTPLPDSLHHIREPQYCLPRISSHANIVLCRQALSHRDSGELVTSAHALLSLPQQLQGWSGSRIKLRLADLMPTGPLSMLKGAHYRAPEVTWTHKPGSNKHTDYQISRAEPRTLAGTGHEVIQMFFIRSNTYSLYIKKHMFGSVITARQTSCLL